MDRWMRHISAVSLSSFAIVSGLCSQATRRVEAEMTARFDEKKPGQEAAEQDGHIRAKSRDKVITLKSSPVKVTIEPIAERQGTKPKGMTEWVKSLGDAGQLHLVLKGLRTETPPGVLYELYLDLPANATAQQKQAHSVGVINFFNFVRGETEDAKDRAVLSFDVTKLAKHLQSEGKLKDKPILTISPVGKPDTNAKPMIDEATLIQH